MANQLSIELVYGLPQRQTLISLMVPLDTTVEQAIKQSGLLNIYPDIDLKLNKVGIWNRACKLNDVLKDGDRVEIYRPLVADPKEIRKRRAQKAKDEGRANKITGAIVNDAAESKEGSLREGEQDGSATEKAEK
jgi:putative ubiquitin-RnfH superfamily antitoxin RatB of RatAB toxin-antitoxin module